MTNRNKAQESQDSQRKQRPQDARTIASESASEKIPTSDLTSSEQLGTLASGRPFPLTFNSIVGIQRSLGNRATERLINRRSASTQRHTNIPWVQRDEETTQGGNDEDQLQLLEPTIEIIEDTTSEEPPPQSVINENEDEGTIQPTREGIVQRDEDKKEGGGAGAAGAIVNTAKAVWDVVKENRPVASAASDNANAIPKDVDWTQLTGWAAEPRRLKIRYVWSRAASWAGDAAALTLTALWYHNGSYQGKGQYINNAVILAPEVDVDWGQTLNVSAHIKNPMNQGTTDAPVAALPFDVSVQIGNVFQSKSKSVTGLLKGNGAGNMQFD